MLYEYIIISLFNSLQYTLYVILSSSKIVSNSSGTYSELSKVFVPRKLECLVLEFELLSRFFVNLFLEVLQVIVIACFYL
jgi:hypothetical protein